MIRGHRPNVSRQLRRDIPLFLLITGAITLLGAITITARSWSVFGPLPTRINTTQRVVALTFDDGPTEPQTTKILSVLRQEQIKATFYLIGVEMVRHPQATDDIIAAGHEIGNHSYTHNSLMFMGWGRLSQEIEKTDALIRQHGYQGPITIRPPYGHKLIELPVYAAVHDRQLVMWDIVLGNEPATTQSTILKNAEQIRSGSIIVMHAMYGHNVVTLNAIEPLVKQLKSQGYQFVTVSELLRLR